jgi:predicted ATP-grasp superfamily ATP-dependent carboligase
MKDLIPAEILNLSQIVISSEIKHAPNVFAFTQEGVAMLSSVLRSKRAISVNIQIMRTFAQVRRLLLTNRDLRRKIEKMEKKYDYQFEVIVDAIESLTKESQLPKRRIGF